MRVLIFSLGHPDRSPGGTERGSYSLAQRLGADPRIDSVVFATPEPGEGASVRTTSDHMDEIALGVPEVYPFTFRSKDRMRLAARLSFLIRRLRPDIVHVHHFLGWGIDIIDIIASLGVPCVLTVHDYALICTHYGQLFTTDGRPCTQPTAENCHRCFPNISADLFARREDHLRGAVSAAAAIMTPSRFACDRLIEWGVNPAQITVIENLLQPEHLATALPRLVGARRPGGPAVVGFFGQVTPYKGLDVLMRAVADLGDVTGLEIRIHGANRAYKEAPFQQEIDHLMKTPAARRLVRFHGEYANADVLALMRACDYVVVPSIWWENSPLVIREAKLAGCGVICSDLGGMREKTIVPPDRRFPAGDHRALAETLRSVAARRGLDLYEQRAQMSSVLRGDAIAFERHIRTYYSAIQRRRAPHTEPAIAPVNHKRVH